MQSEIDKVHNMLSQARTELKVRAAAHKNNACISDISETPYFTSRWLLPPKFGTYYHTHIHTIFSTTWAPCWHYIQHY
jgi:hypothetical protein